MYKSTKLMSAGLALAVASLALTLRLFGQDVEKKPAQTNQSTNRAKTLGGLTSRTATQQDCSKYAWDIPKDAAETKNPIEATRESLVKGKVLCMTEKGNCIF